MAARLRAYLDQEVPRYTSYPTAPHFGPAVDGAVYAAWLRALDPGTPLSLYLHVPFCAKMCWYCGCHTKIVRRQAPVEAYAKSLAAEIALVAAALPRRMGVTAIHWGGGTPTMLSAADFRALMDRLGTCFEIAAEADIAVEIDPRTLSRDMAGVLARAGVTRASLGVQDFNPDIQRAINRVQSYETTAGAVADLRGAGVAAINFDLMYGLPGQTVADVVRSVDLSASLEPDRVALFGYAHVPWMKRHQQRIDEAALPGGTERLAQLEGAAAQLAGHGYRRVGLDHFARAGDPMARALDDGSLRRNFQGYTVDPAPVLLGFGASAIGSLAEGYVQNLVPIKGYADAVAAGRLPVARGVEVDDEDRLRRDVVERLMCDSAIDLGAVCRAHGAAAGHFDTELHSLRRFERDGLLTISGHRIHLTAAGAPFVRNVCAVFDSYLKTGAGRHSRAV